MKVRIAFVIAVLATFVYSAAALVATPAPSLDICCISTDNCPHGYRCRYDGGPDCGPEGPGVCVPIIVG